MRLDQQSFSAPTRYMILDGLRGVAALLVICYHVGEGVATSSVDQIINHGYLAVDFFFMLSGFVIGYAYDRRWNDGRLTVRNFFRRRLLRLHPMLMLGIVLGLVTFAVQGFDRWDGMPVSLTWIFVSALLAMFLIPAYPGAPYDVRGNGEMFPLDGPAWSLFFEYIGNFVYALLLRRLPTKILMALAVVAGAGLCCFSIGNLSGCYHLGVGWTLGGYNFIGGMLRLFFSFTVGLLMARLYRPRHIRGAFWICTILIVGLLAMPFWGDIASGQDGSMACTIRCVSYLFFRSFFISEHPVTQDESGTVGLVICLAVSHIRFILSIILLCICSIIGCGRMGFHFLRLFRGQLPLLLSLL